jgi:hypothetical protein
MRTQCDTVARLASTCGPKKIAYKWPRENLPEDFHSSLFSLFAPMRAFLFRIEFNGPVPVGRLHHAIPANISASGGAGAYLGSVRLHTYRLLISLISAFA